ncbi:MAG TPA: hypothetical protein VKA84_25420 [Gemmatimonadaceae bacterium]|nr:hypothetical protein [Gemmatimonadaceae bacterium]
MSPTSRTTRSHPLRPLVVTGLALIALAASVATTQAQSPAPDRARLDRAPVATSRVVAAGTQPPAAVAGDRSESAYSAEFTGVGPEGRDMVWRGAVAGTAVGELTVRLAHVGRDVDTAKPTWPVEGVIFVSGDDPRRAFAADVRGTIDWRTKVLTLAGEVTVGYLRGAHVEQTADLINLDLSGELRLVPATLAAAQ